jgi:hypothetical protein
MATIRLDRDEYARFGLPPCCIVCGEPTDEEDIEHHFVWMPWWNYLSLLFFIVPFFIVEPLTSRKCVISLPFCEDHRGYLWNRLWLYVGIVGSYFGLLASIITLGFVRESGWAAAVVLICFLVLLLATIVFFAASIRPTHIGHNSIRLTNVSRRFCEEVQRLHEQTSGHKT